MEKIGNIEGIEKELFNGIKENLSKIVDILPKNEIPDLNSAVKILREIRKISYENINQFQHEALILRAVKWLNENNDDNLEWFWNPHQTGGADEPDLEGRNSKGEIIVSAEITTSENPVNRRR